MKKHTVLFVLLLIMSGQVFAVNPQSVRGAAIQNKQQSFEKRKLQELKKLSEIKKLIKGRERNKSSAGAYLLTVAAVAATGAATTFIGSFIPRIFPS